MSSNGSMTFWSRIDRLLSRRVAVAGMEEAGVEGGVAIPIAGIAIAAIFAIGALGQSLIETDQQRQYEKAMKHQEMILRMVYKGIVSES